MATNYIKIADNLKDIKANYEMGFITPYEAVTKVVDVITKFGGSLDFTLRCEISSAERKWGEIEPIVRTATVAACRHLAAKDNEKVIEAAFSAAKGDVYYPVLELMYKLYFNEEEE